MTEPQIWAALGILAASLTALVTVVTQSFSRTLDGLRTEMVLRFERQDMRFDQQDLRFDQLDTRIDAVETRMGAVEHRLGRLATRVDDMDRDVQAISKRIFPE